MAKKQKPKSMVYLTDQSTPDMREVVLYLEDRIAEMEMDEETMEENSEIPLPPLLRGLVSFIREEHLEEDEPEEEPVGFDDPDDYADEEIDGELDFE